MMHVPLNIYNGGVFTPKGDLRVLVVFVRYGGVYDTMHVDGWDNGDFPDWANSMTEKAFYETLSEFSNNIYSDNNRKSVSNYYYQMSQGQFRLVADFYPNVITLNPNDYDNLWEFHKGVLKQIPRTFDWTLYDNRTNHPDYEFDNSNSSPDNRADYVVICHRFSREWLSFPTSWHSDISFDGVSSLKLGGPCYVSYNPAMSIYDGFTYMSGGMYLYSLVVDEQIIDTKRMILTK